MALRMAGISVSVRPGMIGAMFTDTGMPAAESSRIARNRPTGSDARGSSFFASSSSSVTSVIVTRPAFLPPVAATGRCVA